jgi:hypothetical protein
MPTARHLRHGAFLYDPRDMIGRVLHDHGEWSENELAFLHRLVGKSDTLVDVGAHIGSFRIETWQHQPQRWNHTRAEPLASMLSAIRLLRLLKIDVEGFEREVLAAAADTLRRLRPIVHCECLHAAAMAFLRELATEHSYRCHAACFDRFNPDNFLGNRERLPIEGLRDTNLLLWPDGLAIPESLRLHPVATFQELVTVPSPL